MEKKTRKKKSWKDVLNNFSYLSVSNLSKLKRKKGSLLVGPEFTTVFTIVRVTIYYAVAKK